MPVMDGVAVIKALRRIAPSAPIAAMSGATEATGLVENLSPSPAGGFLLKPFNLESLLRTVHDAIGSPQFFLMIRTVRTVCFLALALITANPGSGGPPTRPGSGVRPRKPAPSSPAPPMPPPGEWTIQTGRRPDPPPAGQSPAPTDDPGESVVVVAEPPPPPPHPLFDDRPLPPDASGTWQHAPSIAVISTETYTEEACTRLLDDTTLPPSARALVLGGRARARMRMWRLDTALADIEAAVSLDGSAAQLRLTHAEILACFGRTDEADSIIHDAFRLDPESTLSARALGLIRFQQGNLEMAAESLRFHLQHAAQSGTATGDAFLPMLHAVASGTTSSAAAVDDPGAPWTSQLTAFLSGRINRDTLLERARDPRGATPDEAACTAWFYLGHHSLSRAQRTRAALDLFAAVRTGSTALPEYRLAVAALIQLGALRADSLPGQLAP